MTTKTDRNSIIIKAELEQIETDLALAQDDAALLERLKSATDRVARLTANRDKIAAELDKVSTAEAKAHAASRFAGISGVSVVDIDPGRHLIHSRFTIYYTKPLWNGFTSTPTEQSVSHFRNLSPDVFDYLVEVRPDLIPAKIMTLAPDDPREAFNRYFISLQRGYIRG